MIPSICLYCGSRKGRDPAHADAARRAGTAIARAGYRLVYGAGDIGLMGEAATAALAAGGQVMGVIPRHLLEWEMGKRDIQSLIVTETMHERKKLMLGNSEGVIALPGGPGTLDELVEVLTWRHLGLHEKPCMLVDVKGYWQPFIGLLEHMDREGFVGAGFLGYFGVAETPEEAVESLRAALSRRTASAE
jgi:hypothetical protein